MLVGGLVAFGAHKMSQKDAKRLEEGADAAPTPAVAPGGSDDYVAQLEEPAYFVVFVTGTDGLWR